jgi:cyclohexanone monooxygenase
LPFLLSATDEQVATTHINLNLKGTMSTTNGNVSSYDAVVMGAGFGGIYMLYKLRNELGLKVRAVEKAGGVGGTWYWNRYPGALSDSETFVYRYSFDKELLQEWKWNTRYLGQAEVLKYLEGVVDRYKLAQDIQLNTEIVSAVYDEARDVWVLKTHKGETIEARYLVTAVGLLSAINFPNIKGRESFKGEVFHTGNWPKAHDFTGKRVGVIGTGSTGIQVITAIAPTVGELTVFQRSPQYSVPVGNGPVPDEHIAHVKANYDQIWDQVKQSNVAMGFVESKVSAMSVSPEERKRVFEEAWKRGGGFRFMFETFNDIATDREANEAAASFVRGKIAEIVKDPETAKKLTPTELYAKRPLCDGGYYATFNQPNVKLADLRNNPIAEITPSGVRTSDGEQYDLDVLIFATGFDAVDGNYKRIDIRGRGGKLIRELWNEGPASFLGVTTAGFPNMFMILGPNGPFTNIPPTIETQVEFIGEVIGESRRRSKEVVDTSQDAEDSWSTTCREIADATLFSKIDSWIFGANVPGKTHSVMFYLAGIGNYRKELEKVRNDGYAGFAFKQAAKA